MNTNPLVGSTGIEANIRQYRLAHATSENDASLEKLEYLVRSFTVSGCNKERVRAYNILRDLISNGQHWGEGKIPRELLDMEHALMIVAKPEQVVVA